MGFKRSNRRTTYIGITELVLPGREATVMRTVHQAVNIVSVFAANAGRFKVVEADSGAVFPGELIRATVKNLTRRRLRARVFFTVEVGT